MDSRRFTGFLLMALGFAVVGAISLGLIDPFAGRPPQTREDLWRALAPYIVGAAALFFAGLWMARPRR